ncbi:MAG: DUF3244 domain-containing protein [Paludibacteraceae bacterium]
MKEIIRTILLVCILGMFISPLKATDNKEIQFNKRSASGPSRAPELYPVSFSGVLFVDEIALSAQNYQGAVTVHISGVGGAITQTCQVSDTQNAYINISALPAGEYTIDIITENNETFTGDFEI